MLPSTKAAIGRQLKPKIKISRQIAYCAHTYIYTVYSITVFKRFCRSSNFNQQFSLKSTGRDVYMNADSQSVNVFHNLILYRRLPVEIKRAGKKRKHQYQPNSHGSINTVLYKVHYYTRAIKVIPHTSSGLSSCIDKIIMV